MSTSGIPTGVMRFKMEVMKKDNSFTSVTTPNVIKRCLKGRYAFGDTIHPPGYIRYIDTNGAEMVEDNITIESGIITIYARKIIEYFGINFVTCDK